MTLETSTLRRSFWCLVASFWVLAVTPQGNFEPVHAGHPLSFWLRQLDDRAPTISSETVAAFRAMGEAAWPPLRSRLVRREGMAHRALRALDQRLWRRFVASDPTEARRSAVLEVVASTGSVTEDQIQDLGEALRSTRHSGIRDAIGQVLQAHGPTTVATLVVLAWDADPEVQRVALRSLRSVLEGRNLASGLRVDVATAISTQLNSPDPRVVVAAGEALGPIADVASETIPVLLERLCHEVPEVRTMSAELLGRIGGRDSSRCVAGLMLCLHDASPPVRSAAATALGRFGTRAAPAIPRLATLVEAGPASVAVAAVRALGRIGPPAESAVPALASCVVCPVAPSMVRAGAAVALRRISARAELAVPALARAIRDPDDSLRESAAEALSTFGPEATRAIPKLIEALGDSQESVRILATQALGNIGPTAAAAVPALQAARNNNPSVMNRPVLEALARIEGGNAESASPVVAEISPSEPIPDTPDR